MKGKAIFFRILSWLVLVQPMLAEAHPLHWATESIGFFGGLIHPITSIEHVFTMLAVGLWMSPGSRQTIYFMPVMFVTLMLVGGSLTLIPLEIAHAEMLMNLSVLILGLMLVLGGKATSPLSALAVANVAVFHGYLHAYDMLLDVDAIAYTVGFALATLVLIAAGMATRCVFNRFELKYSVER